jgi:hypothetical protein
MGLSASYERSSETLDATNLHIDSPQMVLGDPDRTHIYSLGLREKNPDRRVVGIENEPPAVLKKRNSDRRKYPTTRGHRKHRPLRAIRQTREFYPAIGLAE